MTTLLQSCSRPAGPFLGKHRHHQLPLGVLRNSNLRGDAAANAAQQQEPHRNYQLRPLQQRKRLTTSPAAAAAATAAVSSSAAAFPALQAAIGPVLPYAMAAAAACCTLLVLLMAVAPAAPLTQRSARSNTPLVALGLLYGLVLLASWSSDTMHLMMPGSLQEGLKSGFNPQFFPTISSVQTLFSRPFTAASFLLHVAAINLIAARSAYLDGLASRVPTVHSILLSAVMGPLGLLSHQITKVVYSALSAATGKDLRPAAKPVLEKSGQGTITIMPYK